MRLRRNVAVLVVGLAAVFACEDEETPQPCTNIPAGGCPLSHGVACEDPSCAAVYACRPNDVWELTKTCPPRPDAGTTMPDADATTPETSTPLDAAVDAPEGAYGGPGCGFLQLPDCSAGFALSCPTQNACCECEDLFVCRNGAWQAWGSCSVDGGVKPY